MFCVSEDQRCRVNLAVAGIGDPREFGDRPSGGALTGREVEGHAKAQVAPCKLPRVNLKSSKAAIGQMDLGGLIDERYLLIHSSFSSQP